MSYGTLHRCENLKFCTFRTVLHVSFTLQEDILLQNRVAPRHRTPQPGTYRARLLTMGVPDHAALPHRKPSSGGKSRDICGAQRLPKWSSRVYTYTTGLFKTQITVPYFRVMYLRSWVQISTKRPIVVMGRLWFPSLQWNPMISYPTTVYFDIGKLLK